MTHPFSLIYHDGREVEASSPRGVFEALQAGERSAPSDLGRYLTLVYTRGARLSGLAPEVGHPDADLDTRCRRALASFVQHGWLRVRKTEPSWPPRERARPAMVASPSAYAL